MSEQTTTSEHRTEREALDTLIAKVNDRVTRCEEVRRVAVRTLPSLDALIAELEAELVEAREARRRREEEFMLLELYDDFLSQRI